MKHFMIAPFLLLLSLPVVVPAGGFEGVITMNESSEGEGVTHRFYFKGDKMRTDSGDSGFAVWDAKKKEGFSADLEDKTYTVIPWRDLALQDAQKLFEHITLTKTGKSEKVVGYACEVLLSKDKSDGTSSELCIAKGLSNSAFLGMIGGDGSGRGGYPAWFRDLVKDGGFPLRQIDRDESGKEESRLEATKVEAKRLDGSLFAPPSGFKRTELRLR